MARGGACRQNGILMILLVGVCLFSAFVGWAIGAEKRRPADGFFWGLLFGPIGVVVAAMMKPASYFDGSKTCPFCAERVKAQARVCKHCGRDLLEGEQTKPEDP